VLVIKSILVSGDVSVDGIQFMGAQFGLNLDALYVCLTDV